MRPPRLQPVVCGFTLIELIVTMIVLGVVAVVILPRFADREAFETRGFADQARAGFDFARKVAVASGRNVCATVAGNSLALTMAASRGQGAACSAPVVNPASGAAYTISAPSGVVFVTPVSPIFRADGTASAGGSLTVRGDSDVVITIEPTGHVH